MSTITRRMRRGLGRLAEIYALSDEDCKPDARGTCRHCGEKIMRALGIWQTDPMGDVTCYGWPDGEWTPQSDHEPKEAVR
jgi:hypothetical protein